MDLKNISIILTIFVLALGTIGGSFGAVLQDNSNNSQLNSNCNSGGFWGTIDLIWKFTKKKFWLLDAAKTAYDLLPPTQKRQVDNVGKGLWTYLCMKNKGDFIIVTKMRLGLYK